MGKCYVKKGRFGIKRITINSVKEFKDYRSINENISIRE